MTPLLWIPLVALAWYRYATEDWVAPWMFWGLIVATAWLAYTLFQAARATAAASNLVAAAATFAKLSTERQAEVHAQASALQYRAGGTASPDGANPFEDDAQRYGWYALAMEDLGIEPVCVIKGWNPIRDPFTAIRATHPYIDRTIRRARKEGFEVSLSDATAGVLGKR